MPHRNLLIVMILLLVGCKNNDERLAQFAKDSCERQAQQNGTIAEQNKQVTSLSNDFLQGDTRARQDMIELQKEFAEGDAAAREKLLAVQQDLLQRDAQSREQLNTMQKEAQSAAHTERQQLDQQRQGVEKERQELAKERQSAPVVAAAVMQVGLILACLLPLLFCGYLVYSLRHTQGDDEAVTGLLVQDLMGQPKLLPLVSLPELVQETAEAGQGKVLAPTS